MDLFTSLSYFSKVTISDVASSQNGQVPSSTLYSLLLQGMMDLVESSDESEIAILNKLYAVGSQNSALVQCLVDALLQAN